MNKTKLILISVLTFLFFGCEKTDDGEFTEPISLYEKVNGNWYLTSLKQTDEIAKSTAIGLQEVELISKLGFIGFQIALNVDENNQPTTYEVSGDVPELFQTSGYWKLESAFPKTNGEPNHILLYSDAAKTQLADKLILTATPGANAVLEFKLQRQVNETPYVSYNFSLKPITK